MSACLCWGDATYPSGVKLSHPLLRRIKRTLFVKQGLFALDIPDEGRPDLDTKKQGRKEKP